MASKVFNEARHSDTPTAEYTQQVRMLLGGNPSRMSDIVTLLLAIAHADGHFHQAEEVLVRRISLELGLDDRHFQSCKATFEAGRGRSGGGASSQTSISRAYKVLGVEPTATDAEVKSAYRNLAKEYHPDVLQSKGLPSDFMEFAKQKMATVNDAWSVVKQNRGL
ncbi:MAG: DnaJ domain-containing protein [Planctomycetes bacterium]|nr:DnaJ domain-containing protein [Planctomycetota bacterium]MBT4027934.1 DnaJ domain-containing protein [Planctomycetota bacterium]MBT4560049.1 DnaJ domain-containing protein [Planctomycetota bacterium]MBT5102332.1 DnaJ domain-containing protein [Planctomycetota bacterium]MBT5120583.1 DnaJ domain-containing protein [Planctomycetota bacterium]